jgi:hypothetical protein
MAQANHVPTAIRVLITDARRRQSTNPVRAAYAEIASLKEHSSSFSSTSPQTVHEKHALAPLSAHLSAIAAKWELNVSGRLNIRQIATLPSDPERDWTSVLRPVGDHYGVGVVMNPRVEPADRRHFIGGSDARVVMGGDERALLRLWREKRGELEPEDLSGDLVVQLGVVTEDLNRRWV